MQKDEVGNSQLGIKTPVPSMATLRWRPADAWLLGSVILGCGLKFPAFMASEVSGSTTGLRTAGSPPASAAQPPRVPPAVAKKGCDALGSQMDICPRGMGMGAGEERL